MRRYIAYGWVLGVVGFVVNCIGIHIESSDSTTNPSHSTQNLTPKTHPCRSYLPQSDKFVNDIWK